MRFDFRKNSINQKKGTGSANPKFIDGNLLMTFFFITMNFAFFFIPLAYLAISQHAALFGKKKALFLNLFSSLLLIFIGFLCSEGIIIFSGLVGLFALPFFFISILFREKKLGKSIPFLVLMAPFVLFITMVMNAPVLNKEEFKNKFSQIETEFIQKIDNSSNGNNIQFSHTPPEEIKRNTHVILKSLQENSEAQLFSSLKPQERLLWLLVGKGAPLFFILFFTCLACFILLDISYEQSDKLKAVILYVKSRPKIFQENLLFAVQNLYQSMETKSDLLVDKYEIQDSIFTNRVKNASQKNIKNLFQVFLKPFVDTKSFRLREHYFQFNHEPFSWNLKFLSVPISLLAFTLLFLVYFAFHFGSLELEPLLKTFSLESSNGIGWIIGLFCSFIILGFLVMQGFFALFFRLRTLFLFLILFILFSLNTMEISFFVLISVIFFGSIGILDYVYHWRGKKLS